MLAERHDATLKGGSKELYGMLEAFVGQWGDSRKLADSLTSLKIAKHFNLIRSRFSDVITAVDLYLTERRDLKGVDFGLINYQKDGLLSKWIAAQEIGWTIHAAEAAASEYNIKTLADCDDLLTFSEPLF